MPLTTAWLLRVLGSSRGDTGALRSRLYSRRVYNAEEYEISFISVEKHVLTCGPVVLMGAENKSQGSPVIGALGAKISMI